MNQKAFTVIEIVIVVIIIAILVSISIPRFIDLKEKAVQNSEEYTAGAVSEGIRTTHAHNVLSNTTPLFPEALDAAVIGMASGSNQLFSGVISPITSEWEKLEDLRYRGPTGREYVYDKDDGTFMLASGGGGGDGGGTGGGTWQANPGIQVNTVTLVDGNPVVKTVDYTQYISEHISTVTFSARTTSFDKATPTLFGEGGVYSAFDWGAVESVQQTSDGGYIMVGRESYFAPNVSYIWVVKLGSDGNVSWAKTFNGGGDDRPSSVQQASDGGFIIGGTTDSFNPVGRGVVNMESFALKLDANGKEEWGKVYTGGVLNAAVKQAADGSFSMVSKYSTGGIVLARLESSTGEVITDTAKCYAMQFNGHDDSFQITSDGGYVITGETKAGRSSTLKLDSNGNVQWSKYYNSGSTQERSYAIKQTQDNGFIIAGMRTSSGAEGYDAYILKVSSDGNKQWSKTYGTDNYDGAMAIQETSDGNYVFGGSSGGHEDACLAKIDSNDGRLIWAKTYGGISQDIFTSVRPTSDSGYIAAGFTSSIRVKDEGTIAFFVVKTDANGNVKPKE